MCVCVCVCVCVSELTCVPKDATLKGEKGRLRRSLADHMAADFVSFYVPIQINIFNQWAERMTWCVALKTKKQFTGKVFQSIGHNEGRQFKNTEICFMFFTYFGYIKLEWI